MSELGDRLDLIGTLEIIAPNDPRRTIRAERSAPNDPRRWIRACESESFGGTCFSILRRGRLSIVCAPPRREWASSTSAIASTL